jgi:glycosyltransferase involved in cell wall biosynthesis
VCTNICRVPLSSGSDVCRQALKLSVTIVHPSLNRVGGAERVCLEVIKALSEARYRTTLVTIERTEWHFLEERFGPQTRPSEEKYIVEQLPKNNLAQIILTILSYMPMLLLLRIGSKDRFIINTYGDLVESIADISYVNAIPARIAHLFSQPGLPSSFMWHFAGQVYDFALRLVETFFPPNVTLTNSTFLQGVLEEFLNINSTVIYPPVNMSRFIPLSRQSGRKNLVVTVSRLNSGKNLGFVPRIAKLVKKACFVLIGSADEAPEQMASRLVNSIRDLEVEDRVKLIVNLPACRLADVLASAKVFLHTQTMEGFGIAIAEAMASGCVPVVPRSGGPWCDILAQKQGVYGYSYMSVEDAAKVIDTLMTDEKLRSEVSARAIERARTFDESFFRNAFSKVFTKVCRQKCNR